MVAVSLKKTTKKLTKKILSLKPKIVGATATTCEIPVTAEIMRAIKDFDRKIVTVVGGYHVSAYPETIYPGYVKANGVDSSGISLLVLGEGEITLSEIAKKVIREKDFFNMRYVDGVVSYYEDYQERMTKTRPRERIKNLDLLPRIKWTKKELASNKFNGMMYRPKEGYVSAVISERGRPFGCSFCSTQSTYGNYVATRSIKDLVDEIEFLIKEKEVNMFVDYSPTANRDHKRIHKFCQEVRRRGLQKKFSLYTLWRLQSPKGKFLVNEEIVADLSDAMYGLKIGFGIESLSKKDESLLEKNNSVKYIKQVSRWFDKHGALMRGFYMITPETDEKSIVGCETSEIISCFDDLRVTHLTPFPGTQFDNALNYRLLTKNWTNYNCEQPVIQSIRLSEEKLFKAQNTILQNFLKNSHRQKRILKKIAAHPHLAGCFRDYNKKMESFGFVTQSI